MINNRVALVTGAAGFLGRYVCKYLNCMGYFVVGTGHGMLSSANQHQWGIDVWSSADITLDGLRLSVKGIQTPSVVVHAAGGSSVAKSWEEPVADFERTVTTTKFVTEFLRTAAPKAKLIYLSSAAVYGNIADNKISETCPTDPISPYGKHKLLAEQICFDYCRSAGVPGAVIRLFSVYGRELRKQLLWDLCRRLKQQTDRIVLWGSGCETRDFMHVSDAARLVGHLTLFSNSESFVVNGGCAASWSTRTIAEYVRTLAKVDIEIEFNGRRREGDPISLVADTAFAQSLGFDPTVDALSGIADYYRWASDQQSALSYRAA